MEIQNRLIGESAIMANGKVADIDMAGLLRRLLLFDGYVMTSVRLQEFPLLTKYLGFTGLRDLLASGLIEIRCECVQLGQTAQCSVLGRPVLPLYSYRFDVVDSHDRAKYISDGLRPMHDVSWITHNQVLKLKNSIVDAIRPLPQEIKRRLFPAFQSEFQNLRLLRTAIDMALLRRLKAYQVPFSLALHQESVDAFKVDTDLAEIAKVSDLEAHQIVECGIMAVAGLSQAVLEMDTYSAISGFCDEDLPLFRHKLRHFYELASSEKREESFDRVIEIADVVQSSEEKTIDIEALLKVRESSDLRDFRRWLMEIGSCTDRQIHDAVAGLRAKIVLKLGGRLARMIRVLITSGTVLKSVTGSIALTACDQILAEKLFPRTGIAAFVNELYPSLFKSRIEATDEKL
jgi:hypothetical protein